MGLYPNLFSPIEVGGLELANRVVLAPVDVGLHGPEGEVTDRYIDFIVERARGDTGLLITEFTSVTPAQRVITTSVWDDRFIPGRARMAELSTQPALQSSCRLPPSAASPTSSHSRRRPSSLRSTSRCLGR